MFSTGDTLYIMPTRYSGGRAITPFSNLAFDKLDTKSIITAKSILSEKGYDIQNAIVGGGDLWVLSPKERSEYFNFICGEFPCVTAEMIPTNIFSSNHSNCNVRYIFDYTNPATKSRELFNLSQVQNAHLIAYLTSQVLKYGYNNCVRIAASVTKASSIFFDDWIYKTKEMHNNYTPQIKKFKSDMRSSKIKTTLKIKNLEPAFGNSENKTVYLFPNGLLAAVKNCELIGI